mgnify:CR=1 FL=1
MSAFDQATLEPPRRDRRRIRAHQDAHGARAQPHRARRLLGDVVRALQLQELAGPSQDAADRRHARAAGPGENAGAVDIGDGLAAVFKIESHNHPSFIEPYQGAATGVGGIIRDIFTMGARPIALLNSLRFGPLDDAAARGASSQASSPASRGYGNSIGIPTVGGEIALRRSPTPATRWSTCFCLGIARPTDIIKGAAERRRQPGLLRRRQDGPRRHPRRDDGVGGVRREVRRRSGRRCRSAIPFMEKLLARGVPRGDEDRTRSSASRTWAPPGLTCSTSRDGIARRRRHRDRRVAACRSARPA